MKRIFKLCALALALSLALAGCGGKKDVKTDSKSETKANVEYSTPITVVSRHLSCKVDGEEKVTGKYPEIVFSKEYQKKYPNLSASIESFNAGWEDSAKLAMQEYASYEVPDYQTGPFVSESSATILRADEAIFSVSTSFYDECGGAHPSHGVGALNFDPKSGELLTIAEVLADEDSFAANLREAMTKEYADIMDEIDSYYYEMDDEPDVFAYMLKNNLYTWNINENGMTIEFSPYEIAPYAYGYLEATLSYEDYPDLIKEEYRITEKPDLSELVGEAEGQTEEVEAEALSEEGETTDSWTLDNPGWDYYVADTQTASAKHISLTEVSKEESDWLDVSAWASDHGFDVADPCYGDDEYSYLTMYADDEDAGYEYTRLRVYPTQTDGIICEYDFNLLSNGPDNNDGICTDRSLFIRYEKIVGDILYVELSHFGYAYEEPKTGYIVAIDLNTNDILFKTEPLTANAGNFQVVDDTIICGYGFTEEDDYLYLLDRFTGERVDSIPLKSAASQMEVRDNTLYVATYNTAYEFKINH